MGPKPQPERGFQLVLIEEVELEAASGLEPESRGFADLRLNHLATPPRALHYRRTPQVDQHLAGSKPPGASCSVGNAVVGVDAGPRHFVR